MKLTQFFSIAGLFALGSCCHDNVNKLPVVDAGPSAVVQPPASTATLTGTATDPDGTIATYLWSQLSGPSPATIVSAGDAATQITGLQQGTYVFRLTATDNDGGSGSDTTSVRVVSANAQTLTLQPANNPNEKQFWQVGSADWSTQNQNEWVVDAWTVNGDNFLGRVAFKFDLSGIPAGATVDAATLYLYSNNPPENGNLVDANFGTNNALVLQRITAPWAPATANWANQPVTTASGQINIPHTALSAEDITVDVTGMVGQMLGSNNYGFFMKLQNEVQYTSRAFVSSYHAAKATKHPKLVVLYH